MRGASFLLALAVLVAVAVVSNAQRCPVSSCSPNDPTLPVVWLNSSSVFSYVRGLVFRAYAPMPNGAAFAEAFTQINITNIREQQATDGTDICDKADVFPEIILGNYAVLGELDWSQMCCAVSTSWEIVNGNVNRSMASVVVTWPEFPDFVAKFHLSHANETISTFTEGTPNTLNLDYGTSYSNSTQKVSFELSNWPWLSQNATTNPSGTPSYVKIFFTSTASLDEPGLIGYSNRVTSILYNASSSKSFHSLEFMGIFTLDDVDYATATHADVGGDFIQGPIEFFSPPGVLVACPKGRLLSNPYWNNMSYEAMVTTRYTTPLCLNATRPSADFSCAGQTWTAYNTNDPTLVIPSNAGKVIVLMNLASASIIIKGTNASIDIQGSATNLAQVTLELSPSELKEIEGKEVLLTLVVANSGTAGGASGINLSSVTLAARAASGCRKPEARRATSSDGRTLAAYLTVSNSGCNRWWIILVAVLISVIIVILIVLILLAMFCKPFRGLVRPFVVRRSKSATG